MQRYLLAIFLVACAWQAQAHSDPRYAAGLSDIEVRSADGSRPFNGQVWYPTLGGGPTMRFGENAVWRGVQAHPAAPLADGVFPLVVVSHGLDGNSFNQSWLAQALAENGYIVAAPNHPGTTTWNRDPIARAQLWERPRDISRMITALLYSARFSGTIDKSRITLIGHSLGGYTVISLAGGRFNVARHEAYCAAHSNAPDCVFFREAGIGVKPADIDALQGDLADRRIAVVVSFDLGATQGFDPQSLADVRVPVLVVGANRTDEMLNQESESQALAAALPKDSVRYLAPEDLGHYDFLGVCKPGAVAVLKEESPDESFVCEAGGPQRIALHKILVDAVQAFLQENSLGAR